MLFIYLPPRPVLAPLSLPEDLVDEKLAFLSCRLGLLTEWLREELVALERFTVEYVLLFLKVTRPDFPCAKFCLFTWFAGRSIRELCMLCELVRLLSTEDFLSV